MADATETEGASETVGEAAWETALGTYLADPDAQGLRRFDYGGFVADAEAMAALDAYTDALEARGAPPDDAGATAYWANLYNSVTVDLVADHYPVTSIRKIKHGLFSIGPWKKPLVEVGGETLSLDDIEHDILRERYPSPLIHYMVNCASVGCPNLQPSLWRAETLDADRERAAREFINSPRGVRVSGGRIEVSSIYKWFAADFGGKSGVVPHLRAYADAALLDALEGAKTYDSHDYDWALNDQGDETR